MLHPVALTTFTAGSLGALASTSALMLLGRAEAGSGWRPLNATSHWWHSPAAARVPWSDWSHTGVGSATHYAATLFWAAGYAGWAEKQDRLSSRAALAGALATSAVAAAVDYGATPKRFTPGWDLVLTKRSMAVAYLAMAAGLAAGALLARRLSDQP
jgi:hypothetical protein